MKLTLLPMLASAVAAAQPAPPPGPEPTGAPDLATTGALPPGMTEPMLMPPGMTPVGPPMGAIGEETPANCRVLPDGTLECPREILRVPVFRWGGAMHRIHRGHREHVYAGGFGHFFASSGS